ncbi:MULTISPECIES: hypothetical protein [Nostocales]|uniref:Uncharacterized protein n=3 Tax=Nostocales TaxID=1161 RepID=A0A8S9SY70_9CYAN|nr:hypothetical protein [Tolypothrix bouteillei]KAF3885055.1 hypothetical protein DA73_0400005965 [Tolypothrix bouteillei VB521301]
MNDKTNIPENTPNNPYFLPLASFFFSVAMLLLASSALANNAVLRSIFSCQAQGLGGAIPDITVWFQQGTNLSFIQAGETIKKVWLDDPSKVTLDFDGPMCLQFGQQGSETGDCESSAASVIHLRRIQKLNIPGLPNTNSTLLTVVTEKQGQRKLYTFRVNYGEGAPEYNTLAVFADPSYAGAGSCIRGNNRQNYGNTGVERRND